MYHQLHFQLPPHDAEQNRPSPVHQHVNTQRRKTAATAPSLRVPRQPTRRTLATQGASHPPDAIPSSPRAFRLSHSTPRLLKTQSRPVHHNPSDSDRCDADRRTEDSPYFSGEDMIRHVSPYPVKLRILYVFHPFHAFRLFPSSRRFSALPRAYLLSRACRAPPGPLSRASCGSRRLSHASADISTP